ncbi:MAG: SAM-dependent methyltransferase, partial [Chloroflexi bacterium]|nr:SAM-dependent methyltransferase [Chloroflexota bacterium]
MSPLEERVAAEVRRRGPIPFDEVMDLALYADDHGFYAHGGAGRRGDFLTNPEVGPLFGVLVGRAIDQWWDALGEPDPFVVVDAGAGPGTLARSVLAAAPRCSPALRYLAVERSAAQRARHREHLPLEEPAFAFATRTGPIVASLAALPKQPIVGVVLANELLDNLPIRLLERTDRGWAEVRVGLGDGDRGVSERLVPATDPDAALMAELVPEAAIGARVPVQDAAADWLRAALAAVDRGGVVVIDYCAATRGFASRPWSEWLRTYRAHQRGGHPFTDL